MSIRSFEWSNQPVSQPVLDTTTLSQADSNPPSWPTTSTRRFTYLLQALQREIAILFRRYILHGGNKVTYLRTLGVRIGQGCDILNNVKDFGTEPWLIELGNRVTLTHGVVLITHDGSSRLFRESLAGSSRWGNRFGTIRIGDNSFVGVNTIIMPDVQIGPNSIVGAGSVVTKDIPANTVAVGVPARPVCTLEAYMARYQQKMVPIAARTSGELRQELTKTLWGEVR